MKRAGVHSAMRSLRIGADGGRVRLPASRVDAGRFRFRNVSVRRRVAHAFWGGGTIRMPLFDAICGI